MKPQAFEYTRATSLQEVFSELDELGDDAKILAGGQSLIPAMNMRLAVPERVIDIAGVAELKGIRLTETRLEIGAYTRYAELLRSDHVTRYTPLLAAALPHVAHPAIRNRGTLGGSLCNADPAAEMVACAVALNAEMLVQSTSGQRTIVATDFIEGTFATCLEPNEVLVSVSFPIAKACNYYYFDELARRQGDYAMAGIAVSCEIEHGIFSVANLIYFAVSEMPVRAQTASNILQGQHVSSLALDEICNALNDDIECFDDLTTGAKTKLHLMQVLTRRALGSIVTAEPDSCVTAELDS